MNRFPILSAASLSLALVLVPLPRADAAPKKSAVKKSAEAETKKPASEEGEPAPSTKKMPPGAADKKKKSADAAEAVLPAAAKKAGASTPLNLPLPTKPERESDSDTAAPVNKAAETSTTPNKPAAKPAALHPEHAPNATVEPDEIAEFATQPSRIQQLLRDAIDLTRLNLTYTFGSADPDSGGMDCSGTIHYLLRAHGLGDVPRDSSGQYLWARKSAVFFPVVSKSAESVEFSDLLPGDLMFWTGTYETTGDVPISHVMLYLGREKESGKRIMFGASDGRSYNGIPRWGVSVFDFKMPKSDPEKPGKAAADFVGFARIPGLRQGAAAGARIAADAGAGSDNKTKAASGEAKTAPSSTKSKSSSRKKKL